MTTIGLLPMKQREDQGNYLFATAFRNQGTQQGGHTHKQ